MKKYFLIILLALIALSLSSCTGQRVAATGWSEITIKEDIVYFSYGPQVYALNVKNGAQQWIYPVETETGKDFYAAPVFTEDETQLIVASYDSNLYSINPATGIENWSFTGAENRYIAAPLVTEQGIFAPSADNKLYGVDLDGIPLWEPFETGEPIWASPAWSESCGCIYVASMDHVLYAVSPETGSLLWKSEDLGGPIVSQPAVSESGLVIVSTFNNEIVALDEKSHRVEWRYNTPDWAWASPVIDGEQVYTSDLSGTFYALELETGNLIWQLQPGGSIVSAPLVQDGLIYFSTDTSSLVIVNTDGVVQRNLPIEGKLYASPASNGDIILLAPSEAEFFLIALNQNGTQIWGHPPAK
ncbi:MAG: PQQ-like beta-propeller repeat protein [Anaerolineales bacterium]|nr:PQQ-like beta-propeller repeat protein [Anaerolineales bacterium]